MAAKPCDPLIRNKQNYIHYSCAIRMWSFPLIWPAVLEKKMFESFRVNSIWPPNHVTYQLEINKLVKGCLGESVCEILPQSVQPFWRRRFKKFINFQYKMTDEPCDLWHHKFTFCLQSCGGICVKFRVNRIRCVFGPGNGSLTLTHLVVLLGLTLFEKSLRLLHFLFKFLQISSHNPL